MSMDAMSLEALQNLNDSYYSQQAKNGDQAQSGPRLDALREAAIGVGARGGLVHQTKIINKALDEVKRNLDTVYDFSQLMIAGRVIPPVLTETREVYTQGDASDLRLAGRTYKVEAQARFSSRPPNWRDYLYLSYSDDPMPSRVLLPHDQAEQEIWKKAVVEGWQQGVKQANDIFAINLNRLNRDYIGMTRYRILALKRMVTMPVLAEQNMPINTTGNSMSLDETLLRITALPSFNSDMRDWMPLSGEVQGRRQEATPAAVSPSTGEQR